MATSTLDRHSSAALPDVICPMCGSLMRLVTIEASETDDSRLTFECRCGHRYRLTEQTINSIARDRSDLW